MKPPGSHLCRCGRVISYNKRHCQACALKAVDSLMAILTNPPTAVSLKKGDDDELL